MNGITLAILMGRIHFNANIVRENRGGGTPDKPILGNDMNQISATFIASGTIRTGLFIPTTIRVRKVILKKDVIFYRGSITDRNVCLGATRRWRVIHFVKPTCPQNDEVEQHTKHHPGTDQG